MSAYSTLKISRSKALHLIIEHAYRADREILERMLDAVLQDRLYNCRVVNDGEPNDEAELG